MTIPPHHPPTTGGTHVSEPNALTPAELDAELGTALPAKEVMTLLDLNIDIDLALALAAPIDLAVAANLNVAAPIDAAVSANVLSLFSNAAAQATQQVMIDQYISGEAIAHAPQDASITQIQNDGAGGDAAATGATSASASEPTNLGTDDVVSVGGVVDDATGAIDGVVDGTDDVTDTVSGVVDDVVDTGSGVVSDVTSGGLLDGNLVNIDVQVKLDADLAAPIAGAVAANANVAAPIEAAAAANVGSIGSEAIAVASQTAIITQNLDGVLAEATAEQTADILQN
jgi:hypothetical protein